MTRSVAEDTPPGRRKHHCSNNGQTFKWHTMNECYTDPRASTPCDEAEPLLQHPLAMPYAPHLYAGRVQTSRRHFCSCGVHSTRHCHMERAHVRPRWAPHITVQCNMPFEYKVQVVEDRVDVNVALTASAPQTLRVNRRYAPDCIRLCSPTRWPHEYRHITNSMPFHKQGHCRSCHHDLSLGQQHG